MRKILFGRFIKYFIMGILIILIIFVLSVKLDRSKTKVYGFANMIRVEDVQELTLTQFKWAGIATLNKKYLNYEADVKTYINIDSIEEIYTIDEANKRIIIKPKKIFIDVLDADINSTIPDIINDELRNQTLACIEDAKTEIEQSEEFLKIAVENEKQILESLVEPFAKDWGFSIKWEEGELYD